MNEPINLDNVGRQPMIQVERPQEDLPGTMTVHLDNFEYIHITCGGEAVTISREGLKTLFKRLQGVEL